MRHAQQGTYVVEAAKTLDDILHRMEAHQDKKSSMLRKLGVATGFSDYKTSVDAQCAHV
jgi:hypothetical protein